MKTEYALKSIEMAKRAIEDETYLNKMAKKCKVSAGDLKAEYTLFLEIEDLKDELEDFKNDGKETDVTRIWMAIKEKTKELVEIQRR